MSNVIGKKVLLTGITKHGKERLQQHGNCATIIQHAGNSGSGFLILLSFSDGYEKWAHFINDTHFKITFED